MYSSQFTNASYLNHLSLSPDMNNKKQEFNNSLSRYPQQTNNSNARGIYDMSTRQSAINPLNTNQSQFIDEEQVRTIITTTTTTTTQQPQVMPSTQRLHSQSFYSSSTSFNNNNDMVENLRKSNLMIQQITQELKGLADSIHSKSNKRQDCETSRSQFPYLDSSVSPISNQNALSMFSSPQIVGKTRSYTTYQNNYQPYNEFTAAVSQNLNQPTSSSQIFNKSMMNKSSIQSEQNPLRVSTFHDGRQTVINFPFQTYTDNDEQNISQNQQQMQQEEKEELSTRRYYVKHEDLEYEEIEDFNNPSKNMKQIKYPYQLNWKRIEKAPEQIENIIAEQKSRSQQIEEYNLSQSQLLQQQQSSQVLIEQSQPMQYVKYPDYNNYNGNNYNTHKSSLNFNDETGCKSYADTTANMTSSYLNSLNYIPYQSQY